MYDAHLTIMWKVIQFKSVEYMPFFPSLSCFLNGICWAAYALIKFDLYATEEGSPSTISPNIPVSTAAKFAKTELLLAKTGFVKVEKRDEKKA